MTMPFRVDYRSHAECDIRNAERMLSKVGKHSLERWRKRLVKLVEQLEDDPYRFPEAYEAESLDIDLREAIFGQRPHIYRMLFTVFGNTVNVLFVRHAAQDWITGDEL
jgi:plasmid stabilization system protein ParE